MSNEETMEVFREAGALLNGHFVLNSGRHADHYVNKDALIARPLFTHELCAKLASHFAGDNIDVVVAPAMAGIALAQHIGMTLSTLRGDDVFAVYAEKDDAGGFVLRRGYDQIVADYPNVLVVEDVMTTGKSVREVIMAVQRAGGEMEIKGVGVLWNRGNVTAGDLWVDKLISLCDVRFDSWPEEECSLCKQGIPIDIDVGHGANFVARQGAVPAEI